MTTLSRPPQPFDASGVFETCRIKGGEVLRLEEHLERLRSSMKTVGISAFPGDLGRDLRRAASQVQEGYVRIAVRRSGEAVVYPRRGIPYSENFRRDGVALTSVPTRWPLAETAAAMPKQSERLSGILARMEGGDAFEVLRLGPHGYLTEGNVSNFFLVKKGTLITPPAWLGVLEGLMRAQVLRAAGRAKIPVLEVPVTRHELFNAEEAFLTNVLMEILPVRSVDGRNVGGDLPGPVTRRLMKAVQIR